MSTELVTRLVRAEKKQQLLASSMARLEKSIGQLRKDIGTEGEEPSVAASQGPIHRPDTEKELNPKSYQLLEVASEEGVMQEGKQHASLAPAAPLNLPKKSKSRAASQRDEGREEPASKDTLEVKIGQTWFVRVGVVLLLTGMAFLANYTYHSVIDSISPFFRATILFLLASSMIVGGIISRARGLGKFAAVLEAGGLAGVFFTIYASHFMEPLRWIGSGLTAGLLLVGWTVFMAWRADRLRSQSLAGFSLVLSYYACVVTPLNSYLLFANLLLAGGAAFYLLKNHWQVVSFLAVPSTYGGFLFWTTLYEGAAPPSLMLPLSILTCYWLTFTATLFLARPSAITAYLRRIWAGLNNAGFYGVGAMMIYATEPHALWLWSLTIGSVFIACTHLNDRVGQKDPVTSRLFLAAGIALVTAGISLKLSGAALGVALTVQSLVLAISSRFTWGSWYRGSAILTATLATLVGLATWFQGAASANLNLAFSSLVLGSIAWFWRGRGAVQHCTLAAAVLMSLSLIQAAVAMWGLMPTSLWIVTVAFISAIATWSYRFHRFTELALLSLPLLGSALFFYYAGWVNTSQPVWVSVGLLAGVVWAGYMWTRNAIASFRETHSDILQFVFSLAEISVLLLLIHGLIDEPNWMLAAPIVAIGYLFRGTLTGATWSALLAQGALLFAAYLAGGSIFYGENSLLRLATITGLATVSLITPRLELLHWFKGGNEVAFRALRAITQSLYPTLTCVLLWAWATRFIAAPLISLALCGMVLLLQLWALGSKRQLAAVMWVISFFVGAVFLAGSTFLLETSLILDVVAVGILVLSQQLGVNEKERLRIGNFLHSALGAVVILVSAAIVWWHFARGFEFATLVWCLFSLAVIGAGLLNGQRIYRFMGLGFLVLTGGLLLFVDLWAHGTLARILGFTGVGAALVGLGFLYNKFSKALVTAR